jgi:4-amino-4-deoxy-L-arabinose transferase-like glycosyltransferase
LLTSVAIGLIFLILARLLYAQKQGYAIALLAALLMALSPFEVALSRVLHIDALTTVFITLSMLTAFTYWVGGASRLWLVASGLLAGASFVAKTPALILMPVMASFGAWYLGRQLLAGEQIALDGLLWLVTALLSSILLWPALWVIPGTALAYIFNVNFGYASRGHEKGNFFLGTLSNDPGIYFYPVSLALHVTPIVLIGLLLAVGLWLSGATGKGLSVGRWGALFRRLGYGSEQGAIAPLLFFSLLFSMLFIAFLTLGTKKQDRYLMPVYPFVSIAAAIAWVWLVDRAYPRFQRWSKLTFPWNRLGLLIIALVLVFNGTLVVLNFPYYFTYFNPLLGGLPAASRLTTVGWGEGVDLAADYLNQKPNSEDLKVVSWYGSTFTPYFGGQSSDYFEQKGRVLGSDYVIVYINQRQRILPDREFFEFFGNRFEPEETIRLQGVPYAWIYPSLGLDHHLEYERYHNLVELLGWEYTSPGVDPDHPVLKPGDRLQFDLWWEYLGKPLEESFFLRLVGADGRVWLETTTEPKPEAGDPATWNPGKIVPEEGVLTVLPGTPPGEYTIQIGFYPETPANPTNVLFFDLGDNPRQSTILPGQPEFSPSVEMDPINVDVGPLRLVGLNTRQPEMKIDEPFNLDLYWQTLANITRRYQVSLVLLDEAGSSRWEWDRVDPVPFHQTTHWRQGDFVRSQLAATPTKRTPGGRYRLALNVFAEGVQVATIPLMPVFVPGRERQFALDQELRPAGTQLEHGLTLLGFQTGDQERVEPGDEFVIDLYWQTDTAVEDDYTVFVHLLGPDGQIYGQQDAQPQGGAHPTGHWAPGEIVGDTYTFTISEDAPAGTYELITGMYRIETGQRLVIKGDGANFIRLVKVDVSE